MYNEEVRNAIKTYEETYTNGEFIGSEIYIKAGQPFCYIPDCDVKIIIINDENKGIVQNETS